VSRYGLVAYASSLDQIGPLTKTVEDCAILLNAIAGKDPLDATSVDLPVPDFRDALIDDIKGIRLGVPKEFFGQGVQPEVAETVRQAIGLLESVGAEVQEVSLPMAEQSLAIYYILAPAECSSNLARYDGVRYGLRRRRRERTHRHDGSHSRRRLRQGGHPSASSSALTRFRRATTTPSTSRRRRGARCYASSSTPCSSRWTRWYLLCRRYPPSR
jgi:aspartyl-tRNA(Asn)/glutamyl-tRNA(Gln) amidotransferase subunit A